MVCYQSKQWNWVQGKSLYIKTTSRLQYPLICSIVENEVSNLPMVQPVTRSDPLCIRTQYKCSKSMWKLNRWSAVLCCCVYLWVHMNQPRHICLLTSKNEDIKAGINTPAALMLRNTSQLCTLGTKHFAYHSNHLFTLLSQHTAQPLLYFSVLFLQLWDLRPSAMLFYCPPMLAREEKRVSS